MKIFKTASIWVTVIASVCSVQVHAGLAQLIEGFSNELEERSARAALQTYQDLVANAGCFDAMRAPAIVEANGAAPILTCTGQTYQLFKNVRAIVHTANELTNDGPTQFSLGLDKRGLGLALRWDAAEEYSAQGSLSGDYLRGQISSLSSRLTALRLGARGFHLNAMGFYQGQSYASNDNSVTGGGAGDSFSDENYSEWGGFINYSTAKGSKAPTDLEDAFGFNGSQFNGGVDYRINNQWVVGGLISRIDQGVDFDSSKSTVAGNVGASGFSLFPFALYQLEHFYASGSLGYQQLHFNSVRAIRYPSLNPDIPSPNTETVSATDAKNTSIFLAIGYNFSYKKISFEPYAHFNAAQIKIDQFIEKDVKNSAFNLIVDDQSINSVSTTVGAALRYNFTPWFAVITPYTSYELVQQSEDKPRAISARYVNAASQINTFGVPTDVIDDTYTSNVFGVSAVLVGSHQKALDGVVAGGLQAFIQYKQIKNLDNYKIDMVELGLRYEF